MKRHLILSYSLFFLSVLGLTKNSFSQNVEVYPSNWWVGMKWNKVQLMVHGDNIGMYFHHVSVNYQGVKISNVHTVENKNYLFIDILISSNANPGKFKIVCNTVDMTRSFDFELKPRRKGNGTEYAQGVTSKDFIYLLMPDRFSNGDPSNDRVPGMRDQSLDRNDIFLRHGGDIQGVINHLDYLKDLGVTTVWPTPVLENDMQVRTEHGYAITNHYKVDPRLGSNDLYKKIK